MSRAGSGHRILGAHPAATAFVVLLATVGLGAPGLAEEGSSSVATWQGGSLERADYESWLTFHELEDSPEAIRERILVESLAAISREHGAEREIRIRLELEAMRQQVLLPALRGHARRELVRRVDERLREASEEELRSRFDAHPRSFREPEACELAVIHFGAADDQLPRQQVELAGEVARLLAAGELTFGEAARRYSTHPSASLGGRIGWRTGRQIAAWGPTATHALRRMSPGERSGLLRLDSGLWFFELLARRDARPMTLEAAKDRIRLQLRQQQIRELESTVRQEHLETLDLKIHKPS